MSLDEAIALLASLRANRTVNEFEAGLAEAAMRGEDTEAAERGRLVRAEAYRSLSPWSGGPFLIEDGLKRSMRGRYSWSSLALILTPEKLKARILGRTYEEAPDRWDDALFKLEQLARSTQREGLSEVSSLSVKCRLLARLDWFGLAGELLWLPERLDGWEIWQREDGWAADAAAVETWLVDRYHAEPFTGGGSESLREHVEAAQDACWDYYDALVGEGDIDYMQSQGLRQIASRLSF